MRQLTITLFTLVITSLFSIRATAQDYRFALGLRLSNSTPTLNSSVSGRYFITERSAVEGLVSFGSRFGAGALLELYNDFSTPGLRWFYGGGIYVGFQDKVSYVGPTGIIGLDYTFQEAPINISVDWKPELDISPDINFVPDAFAVSIRFTIPKKH
ncbi:MAG: hypothetical protein P0Y53_19910 [Candidatus Pseudobacter hemicellulosilyticus]|uniref:Uncharacterized protein n=1 Tax=Candidatus Pseudobacter hemicellulosilyticus TaxID=3121375 RepID=A0AAJ6BF51_9BACT|nr:MAG: hypothetical protein P0Y53_19910 [Pseudobacter sp.]